MEIKSIKKENEQSRKYKLIGSRHTKSYRTNENNVLKIFLDNNYYNEILKKHNKDFLEYLKYLSSIKNSSFVTPEIAYVNHENLVRSYVRKFILGTSLGDLYPKTAIDPLIDEIEKLYYELENCPEISLDGITAKDMIYTGNEILLTDFDLCTFNDFDNYKANLKKLDEAIFIGLFKLKTSDLEAFNKDYVELIKRLKDTDYHITDYLKDYKESLTRRGNKTKYLRSLQSKIILK